MISHFVVELTDLFTKMGVSWDEIINVIGILDKRIHILEHEKEK